MAKIAEVRMKTKNGLEVVLSSPNEGEGPAILEVVKIIMEQSEHLLTTASEFTVTEEQEEQMIRDYLKHPDKIIIVPKIDGKPVGMMNFNCGHRRRIAHQGEFGMSVHPNFQGLGIGRFMLKELINWAQKNPNIETIRLRVHAKNSHAIALYQANGFREEGREVRGIKFEEGFYDDVITMALKVE